MRSFLLILLSGCSLNPQFEIWNNQKVECKLNKNLVYKGYFLNKPSQNLEKLLICNTDSKIELKLDCTIK